MEVAGKVAVINGGKRIGHVVALELARRGADVALSYRSSKREAEETAGAVESTGRRALVHRADVGRSADCEALMSSVAAEFGRLDILVHMASIYRSVPFEALTEAAWNEDLSANLTSAFLCAKAAVPYMRRAGGGRIITFSDWVARSGRPRYRDYVSYYVAKAGVIALTEALALELSGDGVLVNAVAPGPIVPPPDMSGEDVRQVADATPLGRWGGPIEVAKTVIALIESDFITGETIRVDGGRHIR